MAYCEAHTVAITTSAGGAATAYTPTVNGRVLCLKYVKTDFADGVDFTITSEDTLQTIWTQSDVNASATVAPRQATHSSVGVASLYAAAGEPAEDYIWLADERVKIVIASGGNAKTGNIIVMVG